MANFEQLQDSARSAPTLEELFERWQKAHEKEEKWEETCPFDNAEARKNFTLDGRLGSQEQGGVLFVCKEANVSADPRYGKKDFWMKVDVLPACEGGGEGRPDQKEVLAKVKRSRTRYYNCLKKTLLILKAQGLCDTEDLKDCAYMNLNKRGGGSRADNTKLGKYIERYKTFIQREVELLKCEVVVLYSAGAYCTDSEVEALFCGEGESGPRKVIKVNWHPSRYSQNKLEVLESELKAQRQKDAPQ